MAYYNSSITTVLKKLKTNEKGLSSNDAKQRLQEFGSNSLDIKDDPLWKKLLEPFADIFMGVLIVAGVLSFLHGDILDGIIVLVIVMVSAVIYYVQRFSTDRILRSLNKQNEQIVQVLRDGKYQSVNAIDIVPGDIVSLGEGEKIPADMRIIQSSGLRSDESLLTGESVPISKNNQVLSGEKEVYERSNMLYQGAFVVAGEALGVVVETGNTTEFGSIAALSKNTNTISPIQQKINKLIKQIIFIVLAVVIAAFGLMLYRGADLTESIRFVLALAVSAVPEGLPVAISVVLVLGMRRMAAKKALVRNMRAIETIGAATTIATDKTGTLTVNKLTVKNIWSVNDNQKELQQAIHDTINKTDKGSSDPLDVAFSDYTKNLDFENKTSVNLPFDLDIAMSGASWKDGQEFKVVIKGAPEKVIDHSNLTENEKEEAIFKLHELTSEGSRVIALAEAYTPKQPTKIADISDRNDLEFLGFVAVADILRKEAKSAIKQATKAGVAVCMITGDHFETAYHIGKELGMVKNRSQVFDSRQMNTMTDEELAPMIKNVRVFSRVIPEHKYRILQILKKNHITAMTGDGVNDVPALSSAHVGISMGSGSQIAKDAGDIILLDDNFKTITDAMQEGRIIIANVRRMLFYLLSTNAGEIITMIAALIIGKGVPIVPIQILWINLVTDTTMSIPLGLEPGEGGAMNSKPRRPNDPILSRDLIIRMILMALTISGLTLAVYLYFLENYEQAYAQTMAFAALVATQWGNAFNARSEFQSAITRLKSVNKSFYIGIILAGLMQLAVFFTPFGELLHVKPVDNSQLLAVAAISFILPIIISEIHKAFCRSKLKK